MVRNVWRRGLVLAAAQLALTAGPAMSQSVPQQADSFSSEELVCALNPKCGADRVMIRRRGITITQPESSARTASAPYFNNITFDFGSAELTNQAQVMLDRIAVALHAPSIGTLAYREHNPRRIVAGLTGGDDIPQICRSEGAVESCGGNVIRPAIHRTVVIRHKSAERDPWAEKHLGTL